jgi:hypothetical protein
LRTLTEGDFTFSNYAFPGASYALLIASRPNIKNRRKCLKTNNSDPF